MSTERIKGKIDAADGIRVGESPIQGINLRHFLRGHDEVIHRLAWCPNGSRLASSSYDGTIRIWSLEDGTCLTVLNGHVGHVFSVSWSPDGLKLASGGEDRTTRIWSPDTGEILSTWHEHARAVRSVAWSPQGDEIASGSDDSTINVWNTGTGELRATLLGHKAPVTALAWSPNGQLLASSSDDRTVRLWNAETGQLSQQLLGHRNYVITLAWSPEGHILASGSKDRRILFWDVELETYTSILEGHTDTVRCISFSSDGSLLASKSWDQTIRIWDTDSGSTLAVFHEQNEDANWHAGIAFHPTQPTLATLGMGDTVIRIWELELDILGSNRALAESIRYTTAKLVLVGDSGVGKTGLGWRLAHGEFKEHSSTHGQQFWVVHELSTRRADGTECEAVLWDLAGQHIYRPIHAIFLDEVDLALVLFDPTNRQEPLKGAEFWLEQLSGKHPLPPTVLVGARVDRGAPVLSQQEYDQFCQRYGISGGYISTSAERGTGLDELLAILKAQIPWDQMTATVTTTTFKRIKEYVLTLKERPDRKSVLVHRAELRRQLQATDPQWQFSDAEMMTAVKHLENHGYATNLRSSSGEEFILLTAELLVDLASSIVLQADKHPRELGAVSETALLQDTHTFSELAGLEETERQILLDAAIVRFLSHNICFRETLGSETLLIFPGLIKQKRPLLDEVEAVEDTSYIIRGRVENVYAALVVLLGYTRTFTRVNQWQNQAQYEMGEGEICGFRVIEEREGEIELVLYYSAAMPSFGRSMFHGLFENFLYQRDVEVTPFPPIICPKDHRQERATVVKRLREGKRFLFCAECGERITLPDLDKPVALGAQDSQWIQREEAVARLRSLYEEHLVRVKSLRRDRAVPRGYLSYLPAQTTWAAQLANDLRAAGVYVLEDKRQLQENDFIILLGTPAYKRAWDISDEPLTTDVDLVRTRLKQPASLWPTIVPLLLEGDLATSRPHELRGRQVGDFRDETCYAVRLFDLILTLYAIPFNHPAFEPLRNVLHQQWEKTLKKTNLSITNAFATSGAHAEVRKEETTSQEGNTMSETYVDFDLHVAPNGHVVVNSPEGQAKADISTELPNNIRLALNLIAKRQTNDALLKEFGEELYNWLFPSPIHTHLHQTESVARAQNANVRLRMRIEADTIASLPLEFVYRSLGGHFLAINPDTVLSRYLNLPLPPERVRRREGPLHMLAIIADPTDQTRLNPDDWEALIREALAMPLTSGHMTLQSIKRATRKEIRNALLQQKPDIIQFVGHGVYKNGKGYLALVDEATEKTWLVDDERFANLYLGFDDHLGLISLATCESATSDDPQGFLGIAPKLVQRGLPAVLAMQYEVYVKTAKVFLEDFYVSVSARKPIDWATQSARNAVSLEFGLDNREFATPVLFMRAADGSVF